MTFRGRIENGVVVFQNTPMPFPDGTLVEVTPVAREAEKPLAALPGTETKAKFTREELAAFEKAVADGLITKERQQALLDLIGMWKMENPPNDEEVERIIEEERMRKYG
jgi:hypothetical protein